MTGGNFHPYRWILGSLAAFSQFDPEFYAGESRIPNDSKLALYRHYLSRGWRHGLNPNAWFVGDRYIEKYQDVAQEGLNPWLHFMRRGVHEGRTWTSEIKEIPDLFLGPLALSESLEAEARKLVDSEYYLRVNSDVFRLGIDPVEHYMQMGWKEGRAPNAWLDIDYLNDHAPVLLPSCSNPLVRLLELTTGITETGPDSDSFWDSEDNVLKAIDGFPQEGELLVVIHAFYPELLADLNGFLNELRGRAVFLITTSPHGVDLCEKWVTSNNLIARVLGSVNRGRDWGPFMGLTQLLPDIGFAAILKLHTKRSPHRNDGGQWFQQLVAGLIPRKTGVDFVIEKIGTQVPSSCMVAARGSLVPIGNWVEEAASPRSHVFASENWPVNVRNLQYPAGSMMWINKEVWRALRNLKLAPADFEPELGQLDGTLAHALERHVAIIANKLGSDIALMPNGHDSVDPQWEPRLNT